MIYVAIRFEFSFSVGTILAMTHDLIITLGIFVLTGRAFSLVTIGAILTVAGYSINDKIVVFDRIREGLRSGRRGTIRSLMNDSINETLSRTVLTSGVTLICMLSLWIFGGPVLDDFAFTNVIGVIVGTYSSIFIDGPCILILFAVRFVGLFPRRQTNRVLTGNLLLNPTACFAERALYRISHRPSITTSSIGNGFVFVRVIAAYISSFRVGISRPMLVNRWLVRRFRSLVENFLVRVRRGTLRS